MEKKQTDNVEVAYFVRLSGVKDNLTRIVVRLKDGAISLWDEVGMSTCVNFGTEDHPTQWWVTGDKRMPFDLIRLFSVLVRAFFSRNNAASNDEYVIFDSSDRERTLGERHDYMTGTCSNEYVFDPEARLAGWRQVELEEDHSH